MQTTARVLARIATRSAVRSTALFSGLALFSLGTTWLQGPDAAQADIGGGLVLVGLLMVAPAVWAAVDARRTTAAQCAAVWGLTGLAVGVAVNAAIVVRQGMQPVADLVVLGGFVAAVVTIPAILSAVVVAQEPTARPTAQ